MHIMNASAGSVAMSAGPVVGSASDDEILRGGDRPPEDLLRFGAYE